MIPINSLDPLEELRANLILCALPVILLTATNYAEDSRAARESLLAGWSFSA